MKRSADNSNDHAQRMYRQRHHLQADGIGNDDEGKVNDLDIQEQTLITPVSISSAILQDRSTTKIDNVRRKLFHDPIPEPISTVGVAVTPSRTTTITPSPAKRKLIFGRSVVEVELKDSVRQVYSIVKKLTGSIGGNGSFGPIYGELTMGSMQKMINLMKEHTNLNTTSRFLDVGSGIGKPNLHVAQDPGVELSYGIEVEADRWLLGMNCLKGVLDHITSEDPPHDNSEGVVDDRDRSLQYNCIFVHGDITDATTFDPFTHVYMFSIGFPPKLWLELSKMWNCSTSLYLICYHGPKYIVQKYNFDVELLIQTPTSMHGSKEGHMGYIYQRKNHLDATTTICEQHLRCDPYFSPAIDIVNGGLEQIRQYVTTELNERMESVTRRTRSQNTL
jgi:hypothetical protein